MNVIYKINNNEELDCIIGQMKQAAIKHTREKDGEYAQTEQEILDRLKDTEYREIAHKLQEDGLQKFIYIKDYVVNLVLGLEEDDEKFWHLSMSTIGTLENQSSILPKLGRVPDDLANEIASAFFKEFSEEEHDGILKEIRHFLSKKSENDSQTPGN